MSKLVDGIFIDPSFLISLRPKYPSVLPSLVAECKFVTCCWSCTKLYFAPSSLVTTPFASVKYFVFFMPSVQFFVLLYIYIYTYTVVVVVCFSFSFLSSSSGFV